MAKEKGYVDLLKLSMIPGIAAVIRSKSCSKFSFRLCVLVCAVTGFVWQTIVLLEEYLRYPTILNIKNHRVEFTRMPGVTFCYSDGFQGKTLRCSETDCKLYTVKEHPSEVLLNRPKYSKITSKHSEVYMLPPETLLKIVNSEYPPQVFTYFNYFRLYLEGKEMKRAPFVKSHSNVPPLCYYFNVIKRNENFSMSIRKEDLLSGRVDDDKFVELQEIAWRPFSSCELNDDKLDTQTTHIAD
ncbi:hypothetical protein TNIN_292031 [Trichonephila inaurata madagascariensis]|uniref:Uncharacterized protein n=1 Tax=Trichonephila inaurata madagascariensis TaxID=2747483 RepID=A0A8X6YJ29_9ARAC|nr:hypothetical protein TNIN_292031 [Trichonephila inaurata madagascariensis]